MDTDEAVGANKEAGSFTGLVGDFGLGFVNPSTWSLPVCEAESLRLGVEADGASLGVRVADWGFPTGFVSPRFGVAFTAELAVFEGVCAPPDSATGGCVDVGLFEGRLVDWETCGLSSSFPLSALSLLSAVLGFGGELALVGFKAATGSSWTGSDCLGSGLSVAAVEGIPGDSGMGSSAKSLRGTFEKSLCSAIDAVSESASVLDSRLDVLDSWLGSLRKPIFPSFSMATKLVRTFDRGLGEQ